ncbi:ABC transporter ATP-binding protein [Lactiplantibacillus paraplantarum]|uniref:ABC transporter ATP-binding protein n=1 Tax=Lactiplantibacillus paraplantarum TaxID=60520 RepID=UPI003B28AA52
MIRLQGVDKFYKQGESSVQVLHDINLDISEGEFVAIMGQSGSGKSTLLNIIGFLDDQFSGTYFYKKLSVHNYTRSQFSKLRNSNVGFVFQNFKLINNLTVQENVSLPLLYAGAKRKDINKRVLEVLQQVGLKDSGKDLPTNLSGGQQQRVSIARAIIAQPNFLIADEPTGALDSKTSDEIMLLFKRLNQHNNTTIIMVTHDEKVGNQAKRLIRILDGRIISDKKVVLS